MTRDITEGRAKRSIAVDLGIVTGTSLWQNNDIAYDMAIGGIPFVLAKLGITADEAKLLLS